MRPSRTVARAALTAALALGALPGLVGSHEPAATRSVDAALFEHVTLATSPEGQGPGPMLLDVAGQSAGVLAASDGFPEVGAAGREALDGRAVPAEAAARSSWTWV